MTKLSQEEMHNVIGGKGITGALLNGVNSIAKTATGFVTDMYGAIATTVFAAKHGFDDDKAEIKIGSTGFKVDNTSSHKIELENQNPANNLINLF